MDSGLGEQPLQELLKFANLGGQLQVDTFDGVKELLDRSEIDINFNFIGLVQIMPLQYKWIGIIAFVLVNVLANTLTVGGMLAFLGTIAGVSLKDEMLALGKLIGTAQGRAIVANQAIGQAQASIRLAEQAGSTVTLSQISRASNKMAEAAAAMSLLDSDLDDLAESSLELLTGLIGVGLVPK